MVTIDRDDFRRYCRAVECLERLHIKLQIEAAQVALSSDVTQMLLDISDEIAEALDRLRGITSIPGLAIGNDPTPGSPTMPVHST